MIWRQEKFIRELPEINALVALGAEAVRLGGTDYYSTLYRLWSVVALGEGSAALFEAMEIFDDPTELFVGLSSPKELPSEVRKMLSPEMTRAGKMPLEEAERVFEFCDKNNIDIISREHEDYPRRLMQLYRPPALLFVKGDIKGLDDKLSISVVGARRSSDYSLKTASAIVRTLARHGFDIVSGFAEGVDICAHLTAVKSGARTYAVLGTGVDVDYPRKNVKYRELIAENGAFISEYLPGTVGMPGNFPQRNRILAALSLGTAVIEASARSGSLNSASHAADLGRPVFAVPPGDLFDSRYHGNAELIRQGAIPMMGARDIYNEYCLTLPHTIDENEPLRAELVRLERECSGVIKTESRDSSAKGSSLSGKEIRRSIAAARKLAKELAEAEEAMAVKQTAAVGVTVKTPVGNAADYASDEVSSSEGRASSESDPEKNNEVNTSNIAAFEGLSDEEEQAVKHLIAAGHPMMADELAETMGGGIDDVLELLTGLEIRGVVHSGGGRYSVD